MLLDRRGQSTIIDGITYTIGMRVFATDESDYEGLVGKILEIRDGEDKETDNETVDIICCFDPPLDKDMRKQIEKRFTEINGEKTKIDDIAMDFVIMSPDMIRAV